MPLCALSHPRAFSPVPRCPVALRVQDIIKVDFKFALKDGFDIDFDLDVKVNLPDFENKTWLDLLPAPVSAPCIVAMIWYFWGEAGITIQTLCCCRRPSHPLPPLTPVPPAV